MWQQLQAIIVRSQNEIQIMVTMMALAALGRLRSLERDPLVYRGQNIVGDFFHILHEGPVDSVDTQSTVLRIMCSSMVTVSKGSLRLRDIPGRLGFREPQSQYLDENYWNAANFWRIRFNLGLREELYMHPPSYDGSSVHSGDSEWDMVILTPTVVSGEEVPKPESIPVSTAENYQFYNKNQFLVQYRHCLSQMDTRFLRKVMESWSNAICAVIPTVATHDFEGKFYTFRWRSFNNVLGLIVVCLALLERYFYRDAKGCAVRMSPTIRDNLVTLFRTATEGLVGNEDDQMALASLYAAREEEERYIRSGI